MKTEMGGVPVILCAKGEGKRNTPETPSGDKNHHESGSAGGAGGGGASNDKSGKKSKSRGVNRGGGNEGEDVLRKRDFEQDPSSEAQPSSPKSARTAVHGSVKERGSTPFTVHSNRAPMSGGGGDKKDRGKGSPLFTAGSTASTASSSMGSGGALKVPIVGESQSRSEEDIEREYDLLVGKLPAVEEEEEELSFKNACMEIVRNYSLAEAYEITKRPGKLADEFWKNLNLTISAVCVIISAINEACRPTQSLNQFNYEHTSKAQFLEYVEEYCERAKQKEIANFGEKLADIAKSAAQDNQAFVVVIAPSGSGKTQAAFAIPNGLRLVLQEAGQNINWAAHVNFGSMVRNDLKCYKIEAPTQEDLDDGIPYETVGLLCYLLQSTRRCKTLGEAAKVVAELREGKHVLEKKTIADLRRIGDGRVVVLDELPRGNDPRGTLMFQFVRNACRMANVPCILMGTDSSTENLAEASSGSRQEPNESWCYLVPRLAKFSPSDKQAKVIAELDSMPSLRDGYEDTNPWLADIALKVIEKHPHLRGADQEAELLELVRQGLIYTVRTAKGSVLNVEGLQGQFAVHTDASMCLQLPSQMVHKHLALLDVKPGTDGYVKLTTSGSTVCKVVIVESGKLLKSVTAKFNANDKFLQLLCGGGGGGGCAHPCFYGNGGCRITTAQAYVNVQPELFPVSRGRDGNSVECMFAVAAIVASHDQRLDGPQMSADDFLAGLYAESRLGDYIKCKWKNGHLPSSFAERAGVTVRYSVNSQWEQSESFRAVAGQVRRLQNKAEADIAVLSRWPTASQEYVAEPEDILLQNKNYTHPISAKIIHGCARKALDHNVQFAVVGGTKFCKKYRNNVEGASIFFVKADERGNLELVPVTGAALSAGGTRSRLKRKKTKLVMLLMEVEDHEVFKTDATDASDEEAATEEHGKDQPYEEDEEEEEE